MKIAVVGAGKVGVALGRNWTRAGHEVTYCFSRDRAGLETRAREAGGKAAEPAVAVAGADVVLLAAPWTAVDAALKACGPLAGKVVVDATNPIGEGFTWPRVVPSGAGVIARKAPGARVVKAFNTVFAELFPRMPASPVRASLFFCGDDAAAKRAAARLVADAGFDPVDAGGLERAADLEAMARLVILTALGQKRGPFAYRLLPPAELAPASR